MSDNLSARWYHVPALLVVLSGGVFAAAFSPAHRLPAAASLGASFVTMLLLLYDLEVTTDGDD